MCSASSRGRFFRRHGARNRSPAQFVATRKSQALRCSSSRNCGLARTRRKKVSWVISSASSRLPSGHRPGGIWFGRTGQPAVPPEYGPCDPPPSFLFLIDTRLRWPKGYSNMKKERRTPMGIVVVYGRRKTPQGWGAFLTTEPTTHRPGPHGNSKVKER